MSPVNSMFVCIIKKNKKKLSANLFWKWPISIIGQMLNIGADNRSTPSGGSWCLDPSLSPFLVKFTQIPESILLDNPHKAAVLSVGCASFSSTLFPSTQLSVNMLGYSTLWTAGFFGNECLWLTLLVKGVNDCLLDNCQINSLSHDCVA